MHPDGCVVRGVGTREAVAGETARFTILMRDRFGNTVPQGGDTVAAELRGQHRSPVSAKVADLGTGTYQVSYTATQGGEHALHVFVNAEPVIGSPFPVIVHADRTVAAHSELDSSLLKGVRVGVASDGRNGK